MTLRPRQRTDGDSAKLCTRMKICKCGFEKQGHVSRVVLKFLAVLTVFVTIRNQNTRLQF